MNTVTLLCICGFRIFRYKTATVFEKKNCFAKLKIHLHTCVVYCDFKNSLLFYLISKFWLQPTKFIS